MCNIIQILLNTHICVGVGVFKRLKRTSGFSQDGGTKTGFTLPPKITETKYTKQQFLDIGQ